MEQTENTLALSKRLVCQSFVGPEHLNKGNRIKLLIRLERGSIRSVRYVAIGNLPIASQLFVRTHQRIVNDRLVDIHTQRVNLLQKGHHRSARQEDPIEKGKLHMRVRIDKARH